MISLICLFKSNINKIETTVFQCPIYYQIHRTIFFNVMPYLFFVCVLKTFLLK